MFWHFIRYKLPDMWVCECGALQLRRGLKLSERMSQRERYYNSHTHAHATWRESAIFNGLFVICSARELLGEYTAAAIILQPNESAHDTCVFVHVEKYLQTQIHASMYAILQHRERQVCTHIFRCKNKKKKKLCFWNEQKKSFICFVCVIICIFLALDLCNLNKHTHILCICICICI